MPCVERSFRVAVPLFLCFNPNDWLKGQERLTMAKKGSGTERLMEICERLCCELGYELCDAGFEKEPGGVYLRVYIDRDGGISLDDCEKYHRALQPMVEQMDYDFMEVCSPGIDRPLKREKDIRKNLGNRVEVRLYKAVDKQKSFTGLLRAMDRNAVVIDMDGEERSFPAQAVAQVRLVPDLSGLDENSGIEVSDVIDGEA